MVKLRVGSAHSQLFVKRKEGGFMAKGANIAEKVETLITPCVSGLGYRIWDVEYVKEGAEWYLRITIDSDNGIGIDDCERVSRAINPIIDEADPIEDFYYLEVSSPGIERVLRRPEHFAKSVGSDVDVRLFAPDERKKKAYAGQLVSYDGKAVTLLCGTEEITIPSEKISKIQTVYDFTQSNSKEGKTEK